MKTIRLSKILTLRDYVSPGPDEKLSIQPGGDLEKLFIPTVE